MVNLSEPDRGRLSAPTGQKAERIPEGLPSPGISFLKGLAYPGRTQQSPKRQADRERRRQAGYMAAYAEDPRQPCDFVHRRRGTGRTESGGSRLSCRLLFAGPRGRQDSGGLHTGEVCQKAGREPTRYGGLYHISDHAGAAGRGTGKKISCKIKKGSAIALPFSISHRAADRGTAG